MKKMNKILSKCKSLSRLGRPSLGRPSSYSSLRSQSASGELWGEITESGQQEIVFVGSSRRRYIIDAELLNHPLMNALIEKSRHKAGNISVKCEVVIFDHLLWLLRNSDPDLTMDSLEELAQLYVC